MKQFSVFLMISLVFFSCKSAQKYYQQGSYEKAAYAAADLLKKNAGDIQAQSLLESSYKKAVVQYDSIIANTPQNKKGRYLDVLFDTYTTLQQLSLVAKQAAPSLNLQIKDLFHRH